MGNFCEKCGAQLREGAVFCGKCGVPTGVQPVQEKKGKEKNAGKKAVIISSAVAAAALVLVVIVGVPYLRSNAYQCKKNMKLAQKSYKAEEYEEALSYCEEALALDGTFVDAYLKAADIYLEMGEYLSAVQALADGGKKTGNDTLAEREEYLREHIVVVNKKTYYDDGSIRENAYDEYGNEMKSVYYNSDGSLEWMNEYEFEYDEFGNPIKLTHYSDGSEDYWGEGECDESGNCIKWILYDSDGVLKWREFEYDESGNVIKKMWCSNDGSVGDWNEFEYDKSGNLIKEVNYDMDGSVETWDEFEYDKSGNLIKHVGHNHGGTSDVEYDESGNAIEHVSHTERREFEYDESGNMIKETSGFIDDISEEWWYGSDDVYVYDEIGNLIRKECHSSDGNITYWSEYEYDELGNQTEREYRSSNGNVEISSESEYDIMGNTVRGKKYGDYGYNYEYEYQYTYISEEVRRKRDVFSRM